MTVRQSGENGFSFLKRDFRERFLEPIGHTNFWGYLILAIFGLGGLSIYIEACKYGFGKTDDPRGLILALFTVFPAIMGASGVQLALDKDNSPTRMAGLFSLILCLGITLIFTTDALAISTWWSIFWGVLCCLLSVLVWWVANGYEEIFKDTIKTRASLGSDDVTGPLNGTTDVKVR